MVIKSFITNLYERFFGSPAVIHNANDPAAPILVNRTLPTLPNPCPPFTVQGFNGQGGSPGSLQAQATSVYISIGASLAFVNGRLNLPIGNWPATGNLIAIPRAGRDLNAYYDRSSLRFFYNLNPKTNDMVYTCESPDIVNHELGHALLDSLRPDLWNTQSLEVFAFHEAFGDINAILSALAYDEIIEHVIRETGGDLKHDNVISRLAEEMGAAIFAITGGVGGRPTNALRNANNNFLYTEPEKLPSNTADNQLSSECHNFSRVFTGAFYDMLAYLHREHTPANGPVLALAIARDLSTKTLYNAVRHAHNTPRFFESVVRAMLLEDSNNGGVCSNAIMEVFTNRRILRQIKMNNKPVTLKMNYKKECNLYESKSGSSVRIGGVKTIKMCDFVKNNENRLYNVEIEVPNDHYLEYDQKGILKLELPVEDNVVIESARACLDYLFEADKVSLDGRENTPFNKEFKVENNKLVRNHVCQLPSLRDGL